MPGRTLTCASSPLTVTVAPERSSDFPSRVGLASVPSTTPARVADTSVFPVGVVLQAARASNAARTSKVLTP